jgi:hypothetical protein
MSQQVCIRKFTLSALALLVACSFPARTAAQQQTESRGIAVEIQGQNVKLYDESHALVIGVSDYTAGWPNLPGVKRDVQAVGEILKQHNFQVETLLNPTSQVFDQTMKSFIARHGQAAGNRLLIYFAGHGYTLTTVDGRELGYIVPADAPVPQRNVALFKQVAISMNEIEVYAQQIESKHALFVFDSCFSGSLFEATRGGIPPAIVGRTSMPVRQFITAGTADQEVPDRSIFREQFIEALRGEADLNGDGYVTGSELGAYLEDKVTNYSNRAQTPRWGKIRNPNLDKGDFVFVLPQAATTQKAAASDLPRMPAPSASSVDPLMIELVYWDTIKNSNDLEDFKAYLKDYPNGRFAALARHRVDLLSPKPAANSTASNSSTTNAGNSAKPMPAPTSTPASATVRPETMRPSVPRATPPPVPDATTQARRPPANTSAPTVAVNRSDAPPTLKATPHATNTASASDLEAQAAQNVLHAADTNTCLQAAAAFTRQYPQSTLRPQLARFVADKIGETNAPAERASLAENYLNVFKAASEAELVQPALLRDYLTLKRTEDAYRLAPSVVERLPDPVGALIDLTGLGLDQVRWRNLKFVSLSRQFGGRAVELIEADKKPAAVTDAIWRSYRTQQLPRLYQHLTLFALASNDKADALAKVTRAIALAPAEPFGYMLLGGIKADDYQQSALRYKSLAAGPERDALLKQAVAQLEQLTDVLAHVVALAEGNAQYQQIHDQALQDLQSYYKYLHNDSTAGLRQLIDKYKQPAGARP